MAEAVLKSVQCISPAGLHSMAYKEWGDPYNPKVLLCVHGVTRVSDDFDYLAQALSGEYRVVCPDVVGRGRSSHLLDPQYYVIPQYVSDIVTLLARLNAETLHWFGTSMGGLIGIALASLPGNRISKLLLNDIGPSINANALARIGEYIGQNVQFNSFAESVQYIRAISAPFGEHTDGEWEKLAADVMRQNESGKWVRHYDLALAAPFASVTPELVGQGERMLWAAYDAIRCPTLLVRGQQSDLLLPEVAQAMTQRGPRAKLIELLNVGHAPTFMHADQIQIAREFFLGDGK